MKKIALVVLAALLVQACAITNAPLDYKQGDTIVIVNHLDDTFVIQWGGLTIFDSANDEVELGYSRSETIQELIRDNSGENIYFAGEKVPSVSGEVRYLHIANSQECADTYCSRYQPGSGVFGNNFNRSGMSTLVFVLTDQPERSAEENRSYFAKARVRTKITKKRIKKKADPAVFKELMQCIDKKTIELAMFHINQSLPVFSSVSLPVGRHTANKDEFFILDKECFTKL